VSVVCGDCSYNPGGQASSRARSKELAGVSRALARGQTLAVERMRDEAARVGGDGVVGVRLEMLEDELDRRPGPAGDVRHFTAVGTAVRRRGRRGRATRRSEPFTSHLSGQDMWGLLGAGYQPLGLVFGFSVYHSKAERRRLGDCGEMSALTDAVYTARELAMGRMQAQAAKLQAAGVVGVTIELKASGPTIRFVALGTAIDAGRGRPDGRPAPPPTLAVDLADPAWGDRRRQ
jgi:uncharacterized protein YbjQ (UPF0145 family)